MKREFTLTEDHLKLLRAMHVQWDDCETGAPAVDPKRPYGGSYVPADIRRILGWSDPLPEEEEMVDATAYAIHRETEHALQIVLRHGPLIGRYALANRYDSKSWERIPASRLDLSALMAAARTLVEADKAGTLAHVWDQDSQGESHGAVLHALDTLRQFVAQIADDEDPRWSSRSRY